MKRILVGILLIIVLTGCSKNLHSNSNKNSDSTKITTISKTNDTVITEDSSTDSIKKYDSQLVGKYIGKVYKEDVSTPFETKYKYYRLFTTNDGKTVVICDEWEHFSDLCTEGVRCPGTKIRIYANKTNHKYEVDGVEYDLFEEGTVRADFDSYEDGVIEDAINTYVEKLNNSYSKTVFTWDGKFIETFDGIKVQIESEWKEEHNGVIYVRLYYYDGLIRSVEMSISYNTGNKSYYSFDDECRYAIIQAAFDLKKGDIKKMYKKKKLDNTGYGLSNYKARYKNYELSQYLFLSATMNINSEMTTISLNKKKA